MSISPCLGKLKSFFATRTPSVVSYCQLMPQNSAFFFKKKKKKKKEERKKFPMLTTKEIFVDLLAVSFGNKPAAVTGKPCTQHIFYAEIKTYMIASSCCYSGNRFNQC